jgi:hypothetical protein
MTTAGKSRIMIFGLKTDGTYLIEFRTGRRRVARHLDPWKRGEGDPALPGAHALWAVRAGRFLGCRRRHRSGGKRSDDQGAPQDQLYAGRRSRRRPCSHNAEFLSKKNGPPRMRTSGRTAGPTRGWMGAHAPITTRGSGGEMLRRDLRPFFFAPGAALAAARPVGRGRRRTGSKARAAESARIRARGPDCYPTKKRLPGADAW